MWNNRPNECVKVGDREIWLSRSCAVVNIITFDGFSKLLLVKRGPGCPDEIGKWCLPCGYLDYDETLYDAARREVWEETGLDLHANGFESITQEQPWHVRSSPSANRQNVTMQFVWQLKESFQRYGRKPDLPKVHSDNCEPGEVDGIEWIDITEILLKKYDMAFNHLDVIVSMVNSLSPKGSLDV